MMIYTEITPNPRSLKFVAEHTFVPSGTYDFPDVSSASASPLAGKVFEFRFTDGVMIGSNFVTVTKKDDFAWEEVIPHIKGLLKTYIAAGQPAILPEYIQGAVEQAGESESDPVIAKIKQLLNDHIRPAVALDGGDIVFESFSEGIVRLKMKGSCSGCPSSTLTLKMGIQGLLTRMVPEVKSVEAV